jgi:hypothetical protein
VCTSHGRPGAPLVSRFDQLLLAGREGSEPGPGAAVNLGGITNLTVVDDGQVLAAYDIGPAGALALIVAVNRKLLGRRRKGAMDLIWFAALMTIPATFALGSRRLRGPHPVGVVGHQQRHRGRVDRPVGAYWPVSPACASRSSSPACSCWPPRRCCPAIYALNR